MLKEHEALLPLPHTPSRHRTKTRVSVYINITKFSPSYLSVRFCSFGTDDQQDSAVQRLAILFFTEQVTNSKLDSDAS